MSEDERSYFSIRAEQEIRAAQSADHPDAARAHYLLAGYYLDLAHNPEATSRSARPSIHGSPCLPDGAEPRGAGLTCAWPKAMRIEA